MIIRQPDDLKWPAKIEKGGRGGVKIFWTLELNDVSSVCIHQFINQSVEQDFWSTSESSQLLFFPNPTHHAQFLMKTIKMDRT